MTRGPTSSCTGTSTMPPAAFWVVDVLHRSDRSGCPSTATTGPHTRSRHGVMVDGPWSTDGSRMTMTPSLERSGFRVNRWQREGPVGSSKPDPFTCGTSDGRAAGVQPVEPRGTLIRSGFLFGWLEQSLGEVDPVVQAGHFIFHRAQLSPELIQLA